MTIETVSFEKLPSAERRAWQEAVSRQSLSSAFLSPDFAEAALRAGLKPLVMIWRGNNGEPLAFLPVQRGLSGIHRPVGAPMNDLQAIVRCADEGEFATGDLPLQLTAFSGDVSGFSHHVPEPYAIIDLGEGYEHWFETQKKAHRKAFANLRNRENRIGRDAISERFVMHDDDPAVLDWVLARKSEQMLAAGHPDLFSKSWPRRLLDGLGEGRGHARLVVSSLRFDERLAAAHVGVMANGVLHHWFPAYERDFHTFAPGHLLLLRMIAAAKDCRIHRIDMATGDYPYKEQFATRYETVHAVSSHALMASAGLAGRFVRKIDRIAMYAGH